MIRKTGELRKSININKDGNRIGLDIKYASLREHSGMFIPKYKKIEKPFFYVYLLAGIVLGFILKIIMILL